jgi:deazaflavin-dependent oxidoreductase (nitroreductase family)
MSDFNDVIISQFRANGGTVEANGFGDSLLLVHSTGAKSGTERVHPLMAIPDGDGWLIAASAAGAATHPAWYFNLLAAGSTTVEVGAADGIQTIPVTVTDLAGEDRDRAWSRFTERSAGFAAYEAKAKGRIIPVLRLDRG